jgi:hypothetical protein
MGQMQHMCAPSVPGPWLQAHWRHRYAGQPLHGPHPCRCSDAAARPCGTLSFSWALLQVGGPCCCMEGPGRLRSCLQRVLPCRHNGAHGIDALVHPSTQQAGPSSLRSYPPLAWPELAHARPGRAAHPAGPQHAGSSAAGAVGAAGGAERAGPWGAVSRAHADPSAATAEAGILLGSSSDSEHDVQLQGPQLSMQLRAHVAPAGVGGAGPSLPKPAWPLPWQAGEQGGQGSLEGMLRVASPDTEQGRASRTLRVAPGAWGGRAGSEGPAQQSSGGSRVPGEAGPGGDLPTARAHLLPPGPPPPGQAQGRAAVLPSATGIPTHRALPPGAGGAGSSAVVDPVERTGSAPPAPALHPAPQGLPPGAPRRPPPALDEGSTLAVAGGCPPFLPPPAAGALRELCPFAPAGAAAPSPAKRPRNSTQAEMASQPQPGSDAQPDQPQPGSEVQQRKRATGKIGRPPLPRTGMHSEFTG